MKFRLSPAAERDIQLIYLEGFRSFGMLQAESYADRLRATLDLLANNPRLARERTDLSPPARVHPFGSRLIVYQIEDGGILVLRIRHGHEDWQAG